MGKYSLKEVYKVIKTANFTSDRNKYLLLKLDKSDYSSLMSQLSNLKDPFVEVILDKDELSLIINKDIWENDFSSKFTAQDKIGPLAIITCEVTEEQVTGFLLLTMSMLSPNNVGVYVQGAFTTDHIFVDYKDLDKATELLRQLKG